MPEDQFAGYASRIAGYITAIEALFDASLSPGKHPTSFSAFHPHHSFHRLYPRMQALLAERLDIHVRRMEHMLRSFILWMAGMLVERTRADERVFKKLKASQTQPVDTSEDWYPRIRSTGEHAVKTQAWTPASAGVSGAEGTLATPDDEDKTGGQTSKTPGTPKWLLKEDQLQADMEAGKIRLSGLSITMPHNLPKPRRYKRQVKKLRPDPLREIDVPKLFARIARLSRTLKRADKMAERLALKALQATAQAQVDGAAGDELNRASRHKLTCVAANSDGCAMRSRAGKQVTSSPERDPSRTPGVRPGGSGRSKQTDHNPLYLRPLTAWLPPEDLYYSTENDEERRDLNMLHFRAHEQLGLIGFRDPPDKALGIPRFRVFEPPDPPQIRPL
ncbi:MAG: hypothetical protein CMK09_14605 [Ponticaulis sp.]|nr:hypothetical protein [Ponticaulis sp.]